MEFPNSFFEDEVRDGFFVSGKMKHFWAAELEVLDQVDKICRRHGFTYFADCGTMLGAARHGGFIPWDDDLDISMKRDELDRFIPIAREELPEGYTVFDLSCEEDYDNLLVRIVNTRSITFEESFMKANHGCPYAAGLDIFPLDHVAPTPELEDRQSEMIQFVFSLAESMRGNDQLDPDAWKTLRGIAKDCGITFKSDMSVKKRLDLVAEWFMRMYDNEPAERITIIANYVNNRKYAFPIRYYDEVMYLPFEGFKIPMAVGYEDILRREYGDYMRPIRSGSAHNYPGFHLMDKAMEEAVGGIWSGYVFKPEHLEAVERINPTADSKLTEMGELLLNAQSMVRTILSSGNPEGLLELLEQCQNLAMSLGEKVETDFPAEAEVVVPKLEKYCELIFRLYTYLTDDASPEIDLEETVSGQENILREAVEMARDAKGKRRVLFLVSRAKWWHLLKDRYEELKADSNVEALVMVVPWYEKDMKGELSDMHFEGELFPDDLQILPYGEVSLEKLLPDEIITQDPFENCTPSTSIHPYFYGDRIKKYTRCLTYISPYIVDDFGLDDERGVTSITYCCNVPGVVTADKIIVQSESLKNVYVKNLSAFTEKEESFWAEKVEVDRYFQKESGAETCGATEEGKKLICFHTGSSVLIKNPENSLVKLSEVLDTFEAHKDKIKVIWWGDEGVEDTFKGKLGTPKLLEGYRQLVEDFTRRGIGEYVVNPDSVTTIEKCRAYYGDGSYVMNRFKRAGRPVMQMDL